MVNDVWGNFGFTQNPYATVPVSPDDFGEFLLVGRDQELVELTAHLTSVSTIPVLVGANGVGKTSIVSVASHLLRKESTNIWPRFLALHEPMQLGFDQDVFDFQREAYYNIARALLKERQLLRESGVKTRDVKSLDQWLKDPSSRQRTIGLSTPAGGGSIQAGSTPSSSVGFSDAGMQMMVADWLEKCFPNFENGGIICAIDNLEILKSSERARSALEALRDGLFAQTGLRWILCGTPAVAGGGALFSARMEGRISRPTFVKPVPSQHVPELIARRLQLYGIEGAYPPVDEIGFERIYSIVKSRLRSALDLCQQYAIYLHTQQRRPSVGERLGVLDRWLALKASEYSPPMDSIAARSWSLFDDLCEVDGEVRGDEADIMRFASREELDKAAGSLDRAGLVERVDLANGEFLLRVTTPGWLIRFERKNYVVEGGP